MSLEKEANKVRQMLLDEMKNQQTIIFDGLLNNSYINKIPESLFVQYFLPCFLGKVDKSTWVMEWISIAGTPMADVGVVKDGTDELLYVVPSILNTNKLLLSNQRVNMSDIFDRYKQINNNIPTQGLNFLIEALNSKNKEILNEVNSSNVDKRWIDILKRYNLINVEDPHPQEQTKTDDDYFDF